MPVHSNVEKMVKLEKASSEDLRNKRARVQKISEVFRDRKGELQLKFQQEKARVRAEYEDNIQS